eukprot:scaffold99592_cov63-Phaeocystis_antarctica.AAC.1
MTSASLLATLGLVMCGMKATQTAVATPSARSFAVAGVAPCAPRRRRSLSSASTEGAPPGPTEGSPEPAEWASEAEGGRAGCCELGNGPEHGLLSRVWSAAQSQPCEPRRQGGRAAARLRGHL